MADIKLTMELTINEAALIRYIREAHGFTTITIVKSNGELQRVKNDELRTLEELRVKYGFTQPLDKTNGNGVL